MSFFYPNIKGFSPTGIDGIKTDMDSKHGIYYDLDGRRMAALRKGIHIVRQPDGTTRKVLVK